MQPTNGWNKTTQLQDGPYYTQPKFVVDNVIINSNAANSLTFVRSCITSTSSATSPDDTLPRSLATSSSSLSASDALRCTCLALKAHTARSLDHIMYPNKTRLWQNSVTNWQLTDETQQPRKCRQWYLHLLQSGIQISIQTFNYFYTVSQKSPHLWTLCNIVKS